MNIIQRYCMQKGIDNKEKNSNAIDNLIWSRDKIKEKLEEQKQEEDIKEKAEKAIEEAIEIINKK